MKFERRERSTGWAPLSSFGNATLLFGRSVFKISGSTDPLGIITGVGMMPLTKPLRASIRLLTAVLVTLSVLLSQFAPAGAAPTYRHAAAWNAQLAIGGGHEHGAVEATGSLAGAHGPATSDASCSSDCPVKYVTVAFAALASDSPKARIPFHVAELIGRPVAAGVGPPRA